MEDIEKLVQSYIESATYVNDNYMDRKVKIHNYHERNTTKIADLLAFAKRSDVLYPLLKHPVNYVRLSAAIDLLSIYEKEAKEVYYEIIEKNIPLMSSSAKLSLELWEEKKSKDIE